MRRTHRRPAARSPAPVDVVEVTPALINQAAGYDCATDGRSILGLSAIRRRWPRQWAALLRACLPADAPVARDATIGEYLRTGAGGLLLPRDQWDANLKKRRASAKVLNKFYGHLPLSIMGEYGLEKARGWHFDNLKKYAMEGLSRDMTLLRQVVRTWQVAIGVEPVAEKWATPRPPSHRRGRGAPHALRDISRLLEKLDREPDVRALVGLAVGCRLREGESLGLGLDDIDLHHRNLRIRDRNTAGWESGSADRLVPIARWVIPLLKDWLRARGRIASKLIFPNRNDPSRPRTSATRAVAGAARRARLTSEGGSRAPWNMSTLRRDGQAVARAAGLPRAAVRGTVGPPDDPATVATAQKACYKAERRLADAWSRLVEPPVASTKLSRAVPRRAPKGTAGHEPETSRHAKAASGRARTSWALPDSCKEKARSDSEVVWYGEGVFDEVPEGEQVARARTAPPAARPARPADPWDEDEAATTAGCGTENAASLAEQAGHVTMPAAAPSPPLPEVVYVPVRDKAAERDAFCGGAIAGGAAGLLLGLGLGKGPPGQ